MKEKKPKDIFSSSVVINTLSNIANFKDSFFIKNLIALLKE